MQFPSSEVILSTSSDLSIRIFSALDGSNPRTLTGHAAAVTSAAIIGRGRHVISSSNDGKIKLWSVSENRCLKTWRSSNGARIKVTKVVVASTRAVSSYTRSAIELEGKVAIAAFEDGSLALYDLNAPESEPPLQALEISANHKSISATSFRYHSDRPLLAVGTVDGLITVLTFSETDWSASPKHLTRFKRNGADITSLSFVTPLSPSGPIHLLVSTADGLPFAVSLLWKVETVDLKVETEYAGYNIDACNGLVACEDSVYASGKDGTLRRY